MQDQPLPDKMEVEDGEDESILAEALEQFQTVWDATAEERRLALEDRRFAMVPGAQWEGAWEQQFENSIRVEINKTVQGVEKIINDYRSNRMMVDFRGVGSGSDQDTADFLDGLYRADFWRCKGQQATDNAVEEGVLGGQGAVRLANELEDELDPDNEAQRIAIRMIADADQSVFWDPNAKLMDKSDAMWCIVVTEMAKEAFEAEYPGKCTSWPEPRLTRRYDWFRVDTVRVAEMYRVEIKAQKQHVFKHRLTDETRMSWAADMDQGDLEAMDIEGWQLLRSRMVKRRRVMKWKLTGAEILSGPVRIAGDQIPVVPYYGKRWFIDGLERSRGHVRLAKDPNRIYNAQISKLTETAALAPTERPILLPEQVAGHETQWAEANINRAPYSLINPIINSADGSITISGPVGTVAPPQLSPVMGALIQITAADIAELTSATDGADRAMSNVSAEAMNIAATRSDDKTGIYMDNARQFHQRIGEVWLSMAREVYIEEGREVETRGPDGEVGTAQLMMPVSDAQGRYRIANDLSAGKYHVICEVSEATATRRDKTVRTLITAAQMLGNTDPEMANAMMLTAMMNIDGDGINDLQDWMRKRAIGAGLAKPTQEEQAAIDEAGSEPQQPDPQALLQLAAAKQAEALAIKAGADTKLSEAKAVETLASAQKTTAEIAAKEHEPRMGLMDRVRGVFGQKGNN